MNSPMDAAFMTRNQGQLISESRVVTTPRRVGGLKPMAVPGIRPIPAQGLADYTLPFIGITIPKTTALIGAVIAGAILYRMTLGKPSRKEQLKAVVDSL